MKFTNIPIPNMNFTNILPGPSCDRAFFYLSHLDKQLLTPAQESAHLKSLSYAEIDRYYAMKDHILILCNFYLQMAEDCGCHDLTGLM